MSKRETFEEDYKFEIGCQSIDSYESGYFVNLPHQCDDWEVISADYKNCPTKEMAIKQMELFVKRAQEALEKLKALP